VQAPDYPTPREGNWAISDFRFHTDEVLPELRLHFLTIGDPAGEPVLVLHGTLATAASMLPPSFAGELFGPGQPLDAKKYFIVIPNSIGHGKSSKPSDGMRTKFPNYNYDDMVHAQYRLVTEHLGVRHLRLIIGNSMGGMHAWMWGIKYPDFMDALVPMAAQPTQVAGRNQMMRRMAIETIRRDPDYKDGNYVAQPRSLKIADAFLKLGMNGGERALLAQASTRAKADDIVERQLEAPIEMDANDFVYRFAAARDYDPAPGLDRIEASVLAINSADDERNPSKIGIMEGALDRVKNGRLFLIPESAETRGHSTTANAAFYKDQLKELLRTTPSRANQDPVRMTKAG
jgi:homoserine O-acetyltransferase/O-succinyltransferase